MPGADLKSLLKRVIEIIMPDLRAYYRVLRKARVIATYPSESGKYWADVQLLKNDESVDEAEPMIPRVEIPVLWGGKGRGVVCPPAVGTLCDLEYYDGDPNHPRISNFRWTGQSAPTCEVNAFVIQKQDGTMIKIYPDNNILFITPGSVRSQTGAGANILTADGTKAESVNKDWLVELGRGGKLVFRAEEIHTYSDRGEGGTYDECPENLRASSRLGGSE